MLSIKPDGMSLENLIKQRSFIRKKLDLTIVHLDECLKSNDLNHKIIESAESNYNNLVDLNQQISYLLPDDDVISDIQDQNSFEIYILDKFRLYEQCIKNQESLSGTNSVSHADNSPANIIAPKLPTLQCPTYDGSALDFHSFFSQFENIIGSNSSLTDSCKLAYLKSYLKGYPYKIIKHLSNKDANYTIAVDLLKSEFLDHDKIINNIFKQILKTNSFNDNELFKLKVWLSELRAQVLDLQQLQLNFLESGSPGNLLLSHIIFDKLPYNFKHELCTKIGNNYPTINHVLDNFVQIIKLLEEMQPHKSFSKSVRPKTFKSSYVNSAMGNINERKARTYVDSNFRHSENQGMSESGTKNNKIVLQKNIKYCVFCCGTHHWINCNKYSSPFKRIECCKALNLCHTCASNKHSADRCPGKELKFNPCTSCGSKKHYSPLCDSQTLGAESPSSSNSENCSYSCVNVCENRTNDLQTHMLPTLSIKTKYRGKSSYTRCLLDLGSQRSYLSSKVLAKLGVAADDLPANKCNVKTFVGHKTRTIRQLVIDMELVPKVNLKLPIFFDDDLDLNFKVNGLSQAIQNLKGAGIKLADKAFSGSVTDNVDDIEGLIGTDLLPYFQQFNLTSIEGGSAIMLPQGIVPFGDVLSFLSKNQVKQVLTGSSELPNHY